MFMIWKHIKIFLLLFFFHVSFQTVFDGFFYQRFFQIQAIYHILVNLALVQFHFREKDTRAFLFNETALQLCIGV